MVGAGLWPGVVDRGRLGLIQEWPTGSVGGEDRKWSHAYPSAVASGNVRL